MAVGINPQAEILKEFTSILADLEVGVVYIFLLKILPIIALIVNLFLVYQHGGKLGLAAVASAFLGGILILINPILSVIFLIVGLFTGKFAVQKRL